MLSAMTWETVRSLGPLAAAVSAADVLLPAVTVLLVLAAVVVHHRHPEATTWRRSWRLVALGATLVAGAAAIQPERVTDPTEALGGAATLLMCLGLVGVLRDRTTRGRAVDITLEVLVASASLAFALAALATAHGPGLLSVTGVTVALQPLATVAAVWLLARVIEVTPDGRRPLMVALLGSLLVLAAQVWRTVLLLRDGVDAPVAGATLLLAAGLVLWAAALLHRDLQDPGPTLPISGFDLQTTNLVTLVLPMLLGPLTAVSDMLEGRIRLWVIGLGAFALPLAVVWLLVRQVRLRSRREFLAQHDPLTGLPNQRLFLDQVEIELGRVRRTGGGFAIMFLDLDRFKTVNDSLGHDVGDDLLRAVAARLRASAEEGDVVARVGGDEFTILLRGVTDRAVVRQRADDLQELFATPLPVGDRELFTGASVGVAVAPRDGETADTLLKHADTAMYRAKADGTGRMQVYSSELNARARLRLALEQELRRAIETDQLRLWYQPKVRSEDYAVVGREALVRWDHPSLGLVPPAGFVTLAEETGLIGALGRWVLDEACRQVGAWAEESTWPRPVAVNISPAQLAETSLDDLVCDAIARSGIHPRLLEIEITETALLRDLDATARSVEKVRAMGVTVTLDDFGTGYAGLGYLTRIPLDRVKLDRSFVQTISPGAVVSPIVEAVLAVANSLQLEVVAEGVETEHQAGWLRDRGCDTFQGYLFGRPSPTADEMTSEPALVTATEVQDAVLAVCRNEPLGDPAALTRVLGLLDHPPRVRRRLVHGVDALPREEWEDQLDREAARLA